MNPFLLLLWARNLYKITLSKRPEDVETQRELEASFREIAAHPKEYATNSVCAIIDMFIYSVIAVVVAVAIYAYCHGTIGNGR